MQDRQRAPYVESRQNTADRASSVQQNIGGVSYPTGIPLKSLSDRITLIALSDLTGFHARILARSLFCCLDFTSNKFVRFQL